MNTTCSSTFLPSCSINFPYGYLVPTANGGFGQDMSGLITSDNENMVLYINEDGRVDVMLVSDAGSVAGSETIDVTGGVISLKTGVITLNYFKSDALDSSSVTNNTTKIPTSAAVYSGLAGKVDKLSGSDYEDKILLGAVGGGIKSSGKTLTTSVTSSSTNN